MAIHVGTRKWIWSSGFTRLLYHANYDGNYRTACFSRAFNPASKSSVFICSDSYYKSINCFSIIFVAGLGRMHRLPYLFLATQKKQH